MSEELPIIYLARHGETAWSLTGQHTGLTDLPLTERGERNARQLGERLRGLTFVRVYTSPLQRAHRTCELAGFGAVAEVDRDLVEWDYGQYEGRRTAEIRAERPDWELFRDGCPGGESPAQAMARADRVVSRLRTAQGNVLLFSSGHFFQQAISFQLLLFPVVWECISFLQSIDKMSHVKFSITEMHRGRIPFPAASFGQGCAQPTLNIHT